MLLFLDTEFTDFQACELISLALVSEDGRFEFYGELSDFSYDACSAFVRSNVWAHLGRYPEAKMKRADLASRLAAWFASLPGVHAVAADSERDHSHLLRAFGSQPRPQFTRSVDLRPMLELPCVRSHLKSFHTADRPQHHALYDARAHRSAWLACPESREIINAATAQPIVQGAPK